MSGSACMREGCLGAALPQARLFSTCQPPSPPLPATMGPFRPQILAAVGLDSLPIDTPLCQLSGGYKRRVALAVQLVRSPRLLLLDEPLAGLDWRARGELVGVLAEVKKACTVLLVSHDLRELAPLVDRSWRMAPGGLLEEAPLPKFDP
jgi:energy-coupling factor transporter ATP-binding protein EcfA2